MMDQILRCECLPQRARWNSYDLAHSELHATVSHKKMSFMSLINSLLTKFVQSRWLDISQGVFTCSCTSFTKTPKGNLADIQTP